MGERGRCHLLLLLLLVFFEELGISHTSTTRIFPCPETERKALMEFKRLLRDPSNRLSSWVGEDCCAAWEGVGCSNTTGHVIKLDLRFSHFDDCSGDDLDSGCKQALGGDISPSLRSLQQLTHLDLSGNHFGHPIPTFLGSLTGLRYLNLSNAGFLGRVPGQLGNISTLHYLDLSYNFYYDDGVSNGGLYLENPRWISRLSSLRQLKMSDVNFAKASNWLQALNALPHIQEVQLAYCDLGGFPRSLPHVNFTSLATLDLGGNRINCSAPNWLLNITTLEYIFLGGNYIYWSYTASTGKLTSLKVLDLSQNVFSNGFLQGALSNLCNLQSLYLQEASIDEALSNLEVAFSGCLMFRLEELDLGDTKLNGPLPYWLGNIKNLKYLDLAGNLLYGPLPASLGNLSSLQHLNLGYNYLNGTPTEGIGQLKGLVSLGLSRNSLSLSEVHLANLSSLTHLHISGNSLVMKESDDWIPPFQLAKLYMQFCKISPSDKFPHWLKTQRALYFLDLSNAGIKATIPNWLPSSLNYLYLSNNEIISFDVLLPYLPNLTDLELSNNSIAGHLPSIMGNMMPNLWFLDLSNNKIIGEVPNYFPNLEFLELSNNLFFGHLPPAISHTMPNLIWLDLSTNNLSGRIPSSFCQNWFSYLQVSNNRLSGEIPNCWKNYSSAFLFDFSNNQLQGGIPDTIYNMQTLEALHLSHNNLSGKLPLHLRRCTSLVTLDLGHNNFNGSIPTWLGESLLNLKTLNLRSNAFFGNIPQLYHLTSLQILDLSNNYLSGCIPRSFGNFSALKHTYESNSYFVNSDAFGDYYDEMWLFMKGNEFEVTRLLSLIMSIDLSNNKLSGNIPEELENLYRLQSLNLSINYLMGKIPENINKMQQLETLDLSRNNLSSAIPSSLATLYSLSHLNLSYNNLSGRIPTGNQLQTLIDPSIYTDNPNLCGPPLSKNCTKDVEKEDAREEDTKSKTEIIWLYASVALGFITGFWVICGTLLLKHRWRILYFRAIDNNYDQLYVTVVVNMARIKRKLFTGDEADEH